MIKVRVDYSTHSKMHKVFSKEYEFNDDKHLENFLNKANREGKKIIGHEVLSNPCVWYVNKNSVHEKKNVAPSLNYARQYGQKFTIQEFQDKFNSAQTEESFFVDGYIVFDNIKSE